MSGSVGITYSSDMSLTAGVLIAGVTAKFGIAVSASASYGYSISATVSVPAHSVMYGAYGVFRDHSIGSAYTLYSNCTTGPNYYTEAYTPWYDGWHIYA